MRLGRFCIFSGGEARQTLEGFREIVNHNGGVSVLVVHNGKALIEKKFRYAYKEVIYEIPAGKLEKGENPEKAGIRELEEECGLKADKLKFLTCLYPTPAYTNEHLYVFFCDFEWNEKQLRFSQLFLFLVFLPGSGG
jgi:8-oxo-dGTP pyrophosphatase MutT (NUDIX family)